MECKLAIEGKDINIASKEVIQIIAIQNQQYIIKNEQRCITALKGWLK